MSEEYKEFHKVEAGDLFFANSYDIMMFNRRAFNFVLSADGNDEWSIALRCGPDNSGGMKISILNRTNDDTHFGAYNKWYWTKYE